MEGERNMTSNDYEGWYRSVDQKIWLGVASGLAHKLSGGGSWCLSLTWLLRMSFACGAVPFAILYKYLGEKLPGKPTSANPDWSRAEGSLVNGNWLEHVTKELQGLPPPPIRSNLIGCPNCGTTSTYSNCTSGLDAVSYEQRLFFHKHQSHRCGTCGKDFTAHYHADGSVEAVGKGAMGYKF